MCSIHTGVYVNMKTPAVSTWVLHVCIDEERFLFFIYFFNDFAFFEMYNVIEKNEGKFYLIYTWYSIMNKLL